MKLFSFTGMLLCAAGCLIALPIDLPVLAIYLTVISSGYIALSLPPLMPFVSIKATVQVTAFLFSCLVASELPQASLLGMLIYDNTVLTQIMSILYALMNGSLGSFLGLEPKNNNIKKIRLVDNPTESYEDEINLLTNLTNRLINDCDLKAIAIDFDTDRRDFNAFASSRIDLSSRVSSQKITFTGGFLNNLHKFKKEQLEFVITHEIGHLKINWLDKLIHNANRIFQKPLNSLIPSLIATCFIFSSQTASEVAGDLSNCDLSDFSEYGLKSHQFLSADLNNHLKHFSGEISFFMTILASIGYLYFSKAVDRYEELRADHYAIMNNPNSDETALKVISQINMTGIHHNKFIENCAEPIIRTHPGDDTRIAYCQAYRRSLLSKSNDNYRSDDDLISDLTQKLRKLSIN